jgi:hypothetical protein
MIERCRERVRAQFGVELRDVLVYLGLLASSRPKA